MSRRKKSSLPPTPTTSERQQEQWRRHFDALDPELRMKPKDKARRILQFPELVDTLEAARLLHRPPATMKRWRYEGVGPDWIEVEGRVMYDLAVLLEYIRVNTRVASVRAAGE